MNSRDDNAEPLQMSVPLLSFNILAFLLHSSRIFFSHTWSSRLTVACGILRKKTETAGGYRFL